MTETFKGSPGELELLIDRKKREAARRDAAVLAQAGIASGGDALGVARKCVPCEPKQFGRQECADESPCEVHEIIAAALTEWGNERIEEAAQMVAAYATEIYPESVFTPLKEDETKNIKPFGIIDRTSASMGRNCAKRWAEDIRALKRTP